MVYCFSRLNFNEYVSHAILDIRFEIYNILIDLWKVVIILNGLGWNYFVMIGVEVILWVFVGDCRYYLYDILYLC